MAINLILVMSDMIVGQDYQPSHQWTGEIKKKK